MSGITLSNQSTWAKQAKTMGPGILIFAAVGGSHIVSSTQAGGCLWVVTTPLGYLIQCF